MRTPVKASIVGFVIGTIFACAFSTHAAMTGTGELVWVNWQRFVPPPEKVTRIVLIGGSLDSTIVVANETKAFYCCKSSGGMYLTYDNYAYFCCYVGSPELKGLPRRRVGASFVDQWGEIPLDGLRGESYVKALRNKNRGFAIMNVPPQAIDTAKSVSCNFFSCNQRHVVLDASGTIWTWAHIEQDLSGSQSLPAQNQISVVDNSPGGYQVRLSGIQWVVGPIIGLLAGLGLFANRTRRPLDENESSP